MTFADYLRAAQLTANLPQKALAQALGVSPQYLNDLLQGRRGAPSDDHLRGVASVLEVPLDTLLYYANRLPPEVRGHVLLDAEIQAGYATLRQVIQKTSTSRAPLNPEEYAALSDTLGTQLKHALEHGVSDSTVAEILRWRWTVYLALKQWAEQQEQADQRFHPEVWLTPEDVEEITEKIAGHDSPHPLKETPMSEQRDERLKAFFQVSFTDATSVSRHEVEVSFLELADLLDSLLPPSRRTSLAFTALEEAYLWSMHSLNALDAPRGDRAL